MKNKLPIWKKINDSKSNVLYKPIYKTEIQKLGHMIKFESSIQPYFIIRPLSVYHTFINSQYGRFSEKSWKRKGLVICHGHNYFSDIIPKLKFVKNWYYVDIDRSVYPDYVADLSDMYHMRYFPNDYFHCVLTHFCFGFGNYSDTMKNIHFILKKNGIFVCPELPAGFIDLISNIEFNEILKKLLDIIPEEKLKFFKEELLRYGIITMESSDMIFHRNIMLNYHDVETDKYMDKISLYHTKKFLQDNNFEFVGTRALNGAKILFARVIKK